MHHCISLNGSCYSSLNNIQVYGIPIMDFLPTLEEFRLASKETLTNIEEILLKIGRYCRLYGEEVLIYDDNMERKLWYDALFISQYKSIILSGNKYNNTLDLVKSIVKSPLMRFIEDTNNIFVILRIMRHPKINPLNFSLKLNKRCFIEDCIYDKRVNILEAYRLITDNKIKSIIILKTLLYREVMILPELYGYYINLFI